MECMESRPISVNNGLLASERANSMFCHLKSEKALDSSTGRMYGAPTVVICSAFSGVLTRSIEILLPYRLGDPGARALDRCLPERNP